MSISTELAILALLVIANGLLAAAETAVVSSRRGPLRKAAKSGSQGASKALSLSENPSSFLSLVQFWLTLTGTMAGVLGGAELALDLERKLESLGCPISWAAPLSFTSVIVGLSGFVFLFGELVPKRLALAYPEKTAARLAGVVGALSWLASPLLKFFSLTSEYLARLVGAKPRTAAESVGEDEVRALVEKGLHAGVFHRAEKEMVDRVLAMDHLAVTALMTPRPKIVFLNIDDPEEVNWRKIVTSGHSYFPVYQGSRDQVVGMAAVKAIWANSAIGLPAKLRDLVTPHLAVPERMTAIHLLEQFKKTGRHMAIVVDEFGNVRGLVTLIDVLEAIVGDIPDGGAKAQPSAKQRADGTWLVDATLGADELKALLKLEQDLPREGEAAFQTLGGFVVAQLGHIPKEAETFDWAGWRFEVIDMDRLRVDKVLITRAPQGGAPVPPATTAP